MATVSELLRDLSLEFEIAVVAGAAGVGRDVRRLVHVHPPSELTLLIGEGDLIVYSVAENDPASAEAADRALSSLFTSRVAGVLTNFDPRPITVHAADTSASPLIAWRAEVPPERLLAALERALALRTARLDAQQAELRRDLEDLARSGGTPAMVLERLVETTGKAGLLEGPLPFVRCTHEAVHQELDPRAVRRAVDESAQAAQRWMQHTADASVACVLYLELPRDRLVRLFAPVWIGGRPRAALSLFARSDELTARDRVALVAAARALATALPATSETPHAQPFEARLCAALAVRAPDASLEDLLAATRHRLNRTDVTLVCGTADVRACVPYESADEWNRRVAEWHEQLSKDLGSVSLGHTLRHTTTHDSDAEHVVVQAAEAALVGEQLFGPGHITSYAEAQLATFLLAHHDTDELRRFYDRALGKLVVDDARRDGDLIATLEAYCETFATQRSADRLGVHRNTVLYRLRRIEEITSVDLEDGPTRLFLQLALLAGRLAFRAHDARPATRSALWSLGA